MSKNLRSEEAAEYQIDSTDLSDYQIELLKIERLKAWGTILSILIPLLIASLTFAFNALSEARQRQSDFELKAAELAFDTEGPVGTFNKARALAALFPDKLPTDFAATFDPNKYGVSRSEPRFELLKLITEYPDQKNDIIEMWLKLFPDHTWAEDLKDQP